MEEWAIRIDEELKNHDTSVEKELWKRQCIYKVPLCVTELNKRAYTPKMASFGPYHHGEEHLKAMEEHKHRALLYFLKRCQKSIGSVIQRMKQVVQELRDSYKPLDPLWLEDAPKFLQLMILDGCFMLEIFRADHNVNDYAGNDPVFGNIYVRSNLKSDMSLLENQLPMMVLHILLEFETDQTQEDEGLKEKWLNEKIINFFYPLAFVPETMPYVDKCMHVLDVLKKVLTYQRRGKEKESQAALDTGVPEIWNVTKPGEEKESQAALDTGVPEIWNVTKPGKEKESQAALDTGVPEIWNEPCEEIEGAALDTGVPEIWNVTKPVAMVASAENMDSSHLQAALNALNTGVPEIRNVTKPVAKVASAENMDLSHLSKTGRPVTELSEAGIRFEINKTGSVKDIKFDSDNGVLSLPTLWADDTIESKLLNIMALERLHVGAGNEITLYVYFMDSIIDTEKDIAILSRKGILINRLGSDKALAEMFNSISKEIILDRADPHVVDIHKVLASIIDYYKKPWNNWRANLIQTYFSNPWVTISLVAAIFLFALTILQTVYTIAQFYKG